MWPFDQNNQQMYQQYANAWDQGTYGQIPPQQASQNYQQFVQNAPPQVVQRVHEQYYQQMPPQQRGNLMESLVQGLVQRGLNPQQAGIQNTNPYNMSPNEAAQLTGYAHQQSPGLLQQVFSSMGSGGSSGSAGSTIGKVAMAGVAALAAKELLNNRGGGGFNL